MKKGFTLIELLAVILILAIIALIAVPIVLNIIETSRKSAVKSSVNGAIDATRLYYAQHQQELSSEFTIEFQANGTATIDGNAIELGLSGAKFKGGTIVFASNGKITATNMLLGDYTCSTDSNGSNLDCTKQGTFIPGTVVYYNPVVGETCNNYINTNSKNETKTGCLKWYAYSTSEDNVNLLLDHNTTGNFRRSERYLTEVINELNKLTTINNWKSNLNLRLIDANDILQIITHTYYYYGCPPDQTCQDLIDFFAPIDVLPETTTSSYEYMIVPADYLETNYEEYYPLDPGMETYSWLYDNLKFAGNFGANEDENHLSYYTSTGEGDVSFYENPFYITVVTNGFGSVSNWSGDSSGIRPVITVDKSVLQ